jgi:hypothetical protein
MRIRNDNGQVVVFGPKSQKVGFNFAERSEAHQTFGGG